MAVPLTARPGVLVQVSGVGVVWGAALVGGVDGGWRDWWVAAVVGMSVVGEAVVVRVPVGAGDGVAGCADGGGWEGGPVPWGCRGFRSTVLLSVVFLRVGRECCRRCSSWCRLCGLCGCCVRGRWRRGRWCVGGWRQWWRSDGEGAGDVGWVRVVGFSPRHSWRRVLLVSLVVRVWWCCCGVLCCLGGGDPWLMLMMLRVMSMRWV